ncbi:hypothetical protein M9H77_35688 [Catharanthus roseus]|uniref:Uncharacterized protein n=1 Tax=Catharanthus roseus TaxID=4058 RepID=A0ACB9ZQ17_CATRO|nr:hypothetical protein M9H77_35688 [Catharanthus roseus]
MARNVIFCLAIFAFLLGFASADWNILKQKTKINGLQITLKNFCEAWRMNVELRNIRDFEVVPEECVSYIGKYMTSSQYKVDSERTIDEINVYLSTNCRFQKDGTDAWIFDIDDTLLSTVPYYKKNGFGGQKLNLTSLEEWKSQGKAPALEHSVKLFNILKGLGVQIILISSRRETLRTATIDNLVDQGIFGWTSLILRVADDESKNIQSFKSGVRKQFISDGYNVWGILGDQWSSIEGFPNAKRAFKLPNPLYYVA